MLHSVSAFLLLLLAQSPVPRQPEPAEDLTQWQTMAGGRIETEASLLRLSGGQRGWTRTANFELDGILRLKFRLASPDADGAVFVRVTIPTEARWPDAGYRIDLHGKGGTNEPSGTISSLHGRQETLPMPSATVIDDIAWHDLEVWAIRDHVTVRIDGKTTAELKGTERQAGYIGLVHNSGILEFKDVSFARIPLINGPFPGDPTLVAERKRDPTFKTPTVLHDEKPFYSDGAMRRRVQGVVLLEATLDDAGRVVDERLIKSLDPDLDLAAVGTVRHWVFTPATRNGVPESIVVTIEMRFNLH